MKKIFFAGIPFYYSHLLFQLPTSSITKANSIYQFKVPGLIGGTIDFSKFKGKKILVVNTASKCGNTPQYDDLEKLYKKYKDKLVIVGFPANNFGGQEPGTNTEICRILQKELWRYFSNGSKSFCKRR